MRGEKILLKALLIVCLFMLSAPTAWAQPFSADINGDVKDCTGGNRHTIPGMGNYKE